MIPGLLLVISGPSGVGKGTICGRLKTMDPTIHLSISMTTRPPREGEKEGREYFFVSEARFQELLEQGELLEWARVYNFYYGTPKKPVMEMRAAGRDVILEIDVQGGLQVKANCPESILVFILPPSLDELASRLRNRGTEGAEAIAARLRWAREELRSFRRYDYAVVNDTLEEAVRKVNAIRVAEKCRPLFHGLAWLDSLE